MKKLIAIILALAAHDAFALPTQRINITGNAGTATTATSASSATTASTATALVSNPTDCSANQYANAIAASGNLTCAQVAVSETTGTVPESRGGTNQTTYATGDIVHATSANTLGKLAVGTQGQIPVVQSTGVLGYENFINLTNRWFFYEEFLTNWASALWGEHNWTAAGVGTGSAVVHDSGFTGQNPGVLRMETGTTTTGSAYLIASSTSAKVIQVGYGPIYCETIVKLSALSDGTDTYSVTLGLGLASVTDSPVDAIRWRYSSTLNSGNWTLSTTNTSSTTSEDSGTAANTNFVRLGFLVNAAGTSVQGYLAGSTSGIDPITLTIPAVSLQPFYYILKSAGTTERAIYIDAISCQGIFTTPR